MMSFSSDFLMNKTWIRMLVQVLSLGIGMFLVLFCSETLAATNQKPTANAGPDQSAGLNSQVTLDGRQSQDFDGVIQKYQWRQTKGATVKLTGANSSTPNFISPAKLAGKATAQVLDFKLTVTDNRKATASDVVTIRVAPLPVCQAPQVLQDGVCSTPVPVCSEPQILQDGLCVNPTPVCALPKILQDGVCINPPPQCQEPQVLDHGICITPKPFCNAPEFLQNGVCAPPAGDHPFNDTGITLCGDGLFRVACALSAFPGQDAEFGRDAAHGDESDGHAGFSFTKISSTGEPLPADAKSWNCVRDNITQLIWEVKTADGGLRDQSHLYTNFSTAYDPVGQDGMSGDVSDFLSAVNAQGLCGAKNWRLPTIPELQGIVNFDVGFPGPVVDSLYFPNTMAAVYWSSDSHARDDKRGWVEYFDDGRIYDYSRGDGAAVRLVRGPQ